MYLTETYHLSHSRPMCHYKPDFTAYCENNVGNAVYKSNRHGLLVKCTVCSDTCFLLNMKMALFVFTLHSYDCYSDTVPLCIMLYSCIDSLLCYFNYYALRKVIKYA